VLSQRTTIVLGVVAAALLAFILLFERDRVADSETAGRGDRVLTRFVQNRVDAMEIDAGERSLRLERHRTEEDELGTWHLAAPVEAPADEDAVDDVFIELDQLRPVRTLGPPQGEDLASFGLDDPRFEVRVEVAAERLRLAIGGEDPRGMGVYVLADGIVHVVREGGLLRALDREVDAFRDRTLFRDFHPSDAVGIRLGGEGRETMRLSREAGAPEDAWRVEAPAPAALARGPRVRELLRLPGDLVATRFVAEAGAELAEYGLDAPYRELVIERPPEGGLTGPRQGRLRVGAACGDEAGERYAIEGDGGPVVCLEEGDLEPLDVSDLRERRLFTLANEDLDRVEVGEVALRRGEDGWVFDEDDTPADDDAIAAWLDGLRALEATELGGEVSGDPVLTVHRVGEEDEEGQVAFRLGEIEGGGVRVQRADAPGAGLFPVAAAEALQPSALRFRSRTLVAREAGEARRFTRVEGGVEERALRTDEGFALEAPLEMAADAANLRALARAVAELSVQRWIAEAPTDQHRLGRVRLGVTFGEGEEAETVELSLGAEVTEGVYARLGDGPVGLLSVDRARALSARFASRDALAVDASDVVGLRLERAAGAAELRREEGAWRLGSEVAPAEATRTLLERLTTLRARAVESYGEPPTNAVLRLTATTAEGGSVTLSFGPTVGEGDEAAVLAWRAGLDVVYRFTVQSVASILAYGGD
jgi:hypothetical protein